MLIGEALRGAPRGGQGRSNRAGDLKLQPSAAVARPKDVGGHRKVLNDAGKASILQPLAARCDHREDSTWTRAVRISARRFVRTSDYVGGASGVARIAADLSRRSTRQPWVKNGLVEHRDRAAGSLQ